MYMPLLQDENGKWIDKAHISEKTKTITFPSGARTAFAYLELDKHADMWYGSELTMIYFDEFQFRTEYQFDVLRSRNRSRANVRKGIRCTLNPDENHFVYDWVKPYLDEEGYPVKDLGGKTRYYLIVDGTLHTDWDADYLRKQFNKEPQTYCYIPSLLTENKKLMEMDPTYKDNLDSLSEKKRKQLLLGCWHVAEESGMYFNREWLKKADKVPFGCVGVRSYDLAASEPTKEQPYPDYTASIQMWKDKEGYYYITGNYINSFKDPDTTVYGRFRKRAGERDNIMLHQAIADGSEIYVVIPQDAGSAGKEAFEAKVKFFTSNGYKVKKDVSVRTESKLAKFEPFASAAEHGLVYIVESTFPNKETLDWFYKELEMFDAQRSKSRKKDEAVDICATGFNTLNKTKNHKIVVRNQQPSRTLVKDVLDGYMDKIKSHGGKNVRKR